MSAQISAAQMARERRAVSSMRLLLPANGGNGSDLVFTFGPPWHAALVPIFTAGSYVSPAMLDYQTKAAAAFDAQVPAGLDAAAAAGMPGWINNNAVGTPYNLGLGAAPGYFLAQYFGTSPFDIWWMQIPVGSQPGVTAAGRGKQGDVVVMMSYAQAQGSASLAGGIPIIQTSIPLKGGNAYILDTTQAPAGVPASRDQAAAIQQAAKVAPQPPPLPPPVEFAPPPPPRPVPTTNPAAAAYIRAATEAAGAAPPDSTAAQAPAAAGGGLLAVLAAAAAAYALS